MFKYIAVAAAFAATPAFAQDSGAAKLSGLRVELRVGYETPTVSQGDVYKLGNSASIGGEAGFDIPLGKVTVGPFVNYDYASAKTCDTGTCLGSDGNLAAGGRIGFNVGSKGQVYGKLGYDRFRLKASLEGFSGVQNLDGVMGAIGYDHNITRNAYVGIEFDYADLGSFAGLNFQRRHVAVTAGYRF
ncbi:outer membrane protein [Novosphingobium cyanobacteriorum]|uniref:Outer membrane beta-barrel protein n=1 Tax=Novosphingobium cyanobacteriorum TaxID=3024215 RepID=A0ABT6CNB1_9SPHN|nr:outer membrane beta-barrel protein [Novosphingobium cyanobacteriorum]MDF8335409.1 outer membrane beta-barrel protein [Novosphingobium cyanobacteriorum]